MSDKKIAVTKTAKGQIKIVLDNEMAAELLAALYTVPIEVPGLVPLYGGLQEVGVSTGQLVATFKPW